MHRLPRRSNFPPALAQNLAQYRSPRGSDPVKLGDRYQRLPDSITAAGHQTARSRLPI
jgi:hypothetical protein